MDRVISPDGTAIAYHRRGAGPPLVLVPGTGAANPVAWTRVVPTLEKQFCVYAMDRRGHGESGDHLEYTIEKEFDDIAALVDSIEEPVNVLGHSFGALCALEASLRTKNIRKLILYEPAMPLPGLSIYSAGVIDSLQALLQVGDHEATVTAYYQEVADLSLQNIERLKASPAWPARVAAAHTLLREAQAEEAYTFDPKLFENMQTPTLLMQGADSPPFLKMATETIHRALPNSRIAVMPGQQHIAMYTAPDLFLQNVLAFLL
jgi:pimeloyl-ACP methyl ester carboxylesterase